MTKQRKRQKSYRDGFCDGWIYCVGYMADLAGLSDQANDVYRGLWAHWEYELQPWAASGAESLPPVYGHEQPAGIME